MKKTAHKTLCNNRIDLPQIISKHELLQNGMSAMLQQHFIIHCHIAEVLQILQIIRYGWKIRTIRLRPL